MLIMRQMILLRMRLILLMVVLSQRNSSFFAQSSSFQIIGKTRLERILPHRLVVVPKELKLFDITATHDAVVVKTIAPRLHTTGIAHHERRTPAPLARPAGWTLPS